MYKREKAALEYRVKESKKEIEAWRNLYVELRSKVEGSLKANSAAVSSLWELVYKYDQVPLRIHAKMSKSAKKKRSSKLKKEGASSAKAPRE